MSDRFCSECGQPLSEGSAFCMSCGAPAELRVNMCSECGQALNGDAVNCPNCGAPVSGKAALLCNECGYQLSGSEAICPNCGAPTAPVQPIMQQPLIIMPESGGLAICAMVFALLFPPLGLILAIIGIKKYSPGTNRGLAKAALIISIITLIAYTIMLAIIIPKIMDTYETLDEAGGKYKKIKDYIPF